MVEPTGIAGNLAAEAIAELTKRLATKLQEGKKLTDNDVMFLRMDALESSTDAKLDNLLNRIESLRSELKMEIRRVEDKVDVIRDIEQLKVEVAQLKAKV